MCKTSRVTINNLFPHCAIARELWSLAFALFEVHLVMPSSVKELLACWGGVSKRC